MQETTLIHWIFTIYHHQDWHDSYLQPRFLARKWCILPDMISINGDPQWMDAFRMENPSINLGIPPFRKPLIWYFIDFNPHPHDICQNPSKMASNHRENDQGDCSMSLQSIGIIRNLSISYSGTQSSIFLYDLLLIIIFPMKIARWFLQKSSWRRKAPSHKTSSFTLRRSPATLEISAPVMILAAQGIKIWGAIDFLGTFAGRKAFAPIFGGGFL